MLGAAIAPLAPRIVQRAAVVDTHAGLVCLEIVRVDKADVVGGYHGQRQFLGELQRGAKIAFFIDAIGTLQLDVETIRKRIGPRARQLPGGGVLFQQQGTTYLAVARAGEQNQPFAVSNDLRPIYHAVFVG